MDDRDSFRLIEPDAALQTAAAILFGALIAALYLGPNEKADVEVTQAILTKADEAKQDAEIAGKAAVLLSLPFPHYATIRDCLPSGRECSQTRLYVRGER